MAIFSNPRAFRLNSAWDHYVVSSKSAALQKPFQNAIQSSPMIASPGHPSIGHLILLVFEAVLEVVCVSLPGYIIARQGMFDAEMQKFLANLNVMLFTPCLIFTKLASQLTADKLVDLAIIPVIFGIQTLVSYLCSVAVAKAFRFKKRQSNFVIAMGVFGNSNSLPISLVLSLAQTISGLHWNKIPGDNDNEVGARGILYLLIFQQLGQLVRWSWGYHVLLAAPEPEPVEEDDETRQYSSLERGDGGYSEQAADVTHIEQPTDDGTNGHIESGSETNDHTPVNHHAFVSSSGSGSSTANTKGGKLRGTNSPISSSIAQLPDGEIDYPSSETSDTAPLLVKAGKKSKRVLLTLPQRTVSAIKSSFRSLGKRIRNGAQRLFNRLPKSVQSSLRWVGRFTARFFHGLWEFMNPPLWAMLVAIIVASVPSLQRAFFTEGTFVQNSVTSAIRQSAGVAVPLILVVLGANLARNTLPSSSKSDKEQDKEDRKLLFASIISRMLLPTIIMTPIIAVFAKYVPISILDDPIFVVVCFLLTGAPSALQLAQICQINGVFEAAMSKLLFQSYVIWILPSTLILVMTALEVLKWAG
ncbi:MAG: hypothetical protein M1814_004315 [Vezdaea aestivalis]|nr:MAG: hypothetical protein M1814_004315 [Vezdaea aestivalis]